MPDSEGKGNPSRSHAETDDSADIEMGIVENSSRSEEEERSEARSPDNALSAAYVEEALDNTD